MDARFNYYGNGVAAKFTKYTNSAGAVISNSALPAATQELVKIRASQINGCACCTDMHTKDAAYAGESQVRLNLVAAWREATVFTEAERAARYSRVRPQPRAITRDACLTINGIPLHLKLHEAPRRQNYRHAGLFVR
jgi:AhpD family alkylhydroperoxidase